VARIALLTLYDRGALGVRYLAAVLERAGHEVNLIFVKEYGWSLRQPVTLDGTFQTAFHEVVTQSGDDAVLGYSTPLSDTEVGLCLDLLNELQPDLVGISARSVCMNDAFRLTEAIRESCSVPIIHGGIGPTVDPESSIQHADLVCIGEGEEALLELADCLDRKADPGGIANLWVRQGDGVVKNPVRPLHQDLDALPFPIANPQRQYFVENGRLERRHSARGDYAPYIYEVVTSRGCPFSCTYCCNDFVARLYPAQKHLRRRSPQNVVEELRLAKAKYDITYIYFQDDVLTFDRPWIEQFAQLYAREVGLPFWCYTHPRLAERRILSALRDCGVDRITMGVQSGSDRILREVFRRDTSRDQILAAAHTLHELGLNYDLDFITNNPFETEEDRAQTLNLLLQLPKPVRLNYGLAKLSFFPSYEITKMLHDLGAKPEVDEKAYRFWNLLYLSTQSPLLPRGFIRGLSRNGFLRAHPEVLRGLRPLVMLQGVGRGLVKRLPSPLALAAVESARSARRASQRWARRLGGARRSDQ
jgi:anaerobic magnesium-protoporphyrin IX monomethyl ester cyclase